MAVDVPKFMNALISDLQSDAWDSDVRLVLDASTEVEVDVETAELRGCLSGLIAELIQSSKRDGTISVITSFESGEEEHGTMTLQIIAHLARELASKKPYEEFQTLAAAGKGNVAMSPGNPGAQWSFSLTLPARKKKQTAKAATSRVAIVVDDDVDMQDFLSTVLESRGFKVIAVNDGFDALIVIDRYQPDIVLTDLFMPNMDGFDLVTRIKNARPSLPVVVFTGYYDSLTTKPDAFGNGRPDYVLPKPMTQAQIATALAAIFKG